MRAFQIAALVETAVRDERERGIIRSKALEESLREHIAKIQRLRAALAEPVQEPVATVTECEACFTPDVCQLRGTCDYYTASQMRIAAPPQRKPLTVTKMPPRKLPEDNDE